MREDNAQRTRAHPGVMVIQARQDLHFHESYWMFEPNSSQTLYSKLTTTPGSSSQTLAKIPAGPFPMAGLAHR